MLRRAALVACFVALVELIAGCAGSGHLGSSSTTTGVTRLITSSRARVRLVGATRIKVLRPALAEERAACGSNVIAPTAGSVARCRTALRDLSDAAFQFARSLVFLRPAPDLEPIVSDSIDEARPVIDTVRLYPKDVCLRATPPSPSVRASTCTPRGRELVDVIAQLEQVLDRWRTELGVGN